MLSLAVKTATCGIYNGFAFLYHVVFGNVIRNVGNSAY